MTVLCIILGIFSWICAGFIGFIVMNYKPLPEEITLLDIIGICVSGGFLLLIAIITLILKLNTVIVWRKKNV